MHKKLVWYQDDYCWYVWKPHGMASSLGKSFSVLDALMDAQYISLELQKLVSTAIASFGVEGELGMLNRLDTPTA